MLVVLSSLLTIISGGFLGGYQDTRHERGSICNTVERPTSSVPVVSFTCHCWLRAAHFKIRIWGWLDEFMFRVRPRQTRGGVVGGYASNVDPLAVPLQDSCNP